MPITIKTPEEAEKMRVAGRLGSEVLDFITPHVKAGVSTSELDRLCHDYMVNIDITVIKDGFHVDTSRMFCVGEASIQAKRLCDITYECMWQGIREVKP